MQIWPSQIQYCQEITYQKPRPRRGYLASTVRSRAPAGASVLRAPCVPCASAGACGCVHCAGAMRPLCVCGRGRSWERVLFVDRRKLSRFAFHNATVLSQALQTYIFNSLSSRRAFSKIKHGKIVAICKKSSYFLTNGK
jgi:hypothetical protein